MQTTESVPAATAGPEGRHVTPSGPAGPDGGPSGPAAAAGRMSLPAGRQGWMRASPGAEGEGQRVASDSHALSAPAPARIDWGCLRQLREQEHGGEGPRC